MKKNKILISFVVLLTLISAACTDDGKEDYLDEFDTILYFRNSGELPATFYATGDDAVYELIVNKAGVNRSAVATVDVQSLTDEALAQYNAVQRTDYKALPQDCYEYDVEKLNFLSSDSYKDVRVTLKTDKIGKLQKTDAANYVIPLQLCNGTDSVNAQKQYAFIIPEVHIPTIGFENSGYVNKTLTNDESKVETVSTNIVLPVKDVWGLQCELEIDKAALDLFNKESGMNYELLQEEYYQLKKTIIFENGKMIAPVEILIDKTVMNYGTYVLPLTITSVSKDDFEVDEAKKTILLGISLIPPSIALTVK